MHGTIRPASNENKAAEDFADILTRRGLCLARVSKPDVAANERALSGYRQYIKDHPDDARRYGIRQPHELSEGQLVLVAVENDAPSVYLLSEAMTAGERRRLMEHIKTLDVSGLPDIASAARDLTRERPPEKNANENYLGLPDLTRRWHYTRQGVHKLAGREDFRSRASPATAAKRGYGRRRISRTTSATGPSFIARPRSF